MTEEQIEILNAIREIEIEKEEKNTLKTNNHYNHKMTFDEKTKYIDEIVDDKFIIDAITNSLHYLDIDDVIVNLESWLELQNKILKINDNKGGSN